MELRQIKDLMATMGKTQTRRLRIKQDNFELELEKEGPAVTNVIETVPHVEVSNESSKTKTHDIPASLRPPVHIVEENEEESGLFITSPMVGTFYTSPGADEPVFVKVGDTVQVDTVVCIVEAMKVMNEVKAGVAGTVKEILVENSHPIEFGTKLFKIS